MKSIYEENKTTVLTPEYFLKEIHSFREIMCSTKYTLEQKTKAFEGLLYIYIAMEDLDLDGPISHFFDTTVVEWERRSVYDLFRGL